LPQSRKNLVFLKPLFAGKESIPGLISFTGKQAIFLIIAFPKEVIIFTSFFGKNLELLT